MGQIDLAVTSKFNLLRLRPIIYPLQGFGIRSDPDRIYDYRYTPKLARSLLRDTASNELQVEESTAAILQHEDESVSALDAEDELSVSTTASKLRGKLGSIMITGTDMLGSPTGEKSVGSLGSRSQKLNALVRRDSQSTILTSAPILSTENSKPTRRLTGPSLQRLVPKFPIRDKLDRTDNIFESRAVGIGAAKVRCACLQV